MTIHIELDADSTLTEGSIIISVDCLVPSRQQDVCSDTDIGHVMVPNGGSLKFPARFYALSKRDLARVSTYIL